MKVSKLLEIADKPIEQDDLPLIASLLAIKLREITGLIPEIEQLLIQHYHTSLEDVAHDALLKLTLWKDNQPSN